MAKLKPVAHVIDLIKSNPEYRIEKGKEYPYIVGVLYSLLNTVLILGVENSQKYLKKYLDED